MSRHNGRASRFSDESLPFAVELPVPEGGFGTQLDVMHSWAKENDIKWSVSRNRFDAGGKSRRGVSRTRKTPPNSPPRSEAARS